MKFRRAAYILIMAILGMMGCDDMHRQPSFQPQEAPRKAAPAAAVPVTGELVVTWGTELSNPIEADAISLERGGKLYRINCALCHGTRETYIGKVGEKFNPPPPSLHDQRIRDLADADVFKRITLGFGRMPAFRDEISPEDRWHIVNYVQTF